MTKEDPFSKICLFLLILLFASCGKLPQTERQQEPEVSASRKGMVLFLSGNVSVSSETLSRRPLEIGDAVQQGDLIETGPDGYCELQFHNQAVIKIEESATLRLEEVLLTPQETKLQYFLSAGTMLAKVNRLNDKDYLRVRTTETVCGVRGTQFLVTADSTETTVAVRQGKVSVIPAGFSLSDESSLLDNQAVEAARALIEQESPVLSSYQQITITNEESTAAAEVLELYLAESRSRSLTEREEDLARLKQFLEDESERIMESVEQTDVQDDKVIQRLQSIDTMDFVSYSPTKISQDYKIFNLSVEQASAKIFEDGIPVGTGRYTALLGKDQQVNIRISLEGFQDEVLVLTGDISGKEDLDIVLNPVRPQPSATLEAALPLEQPLAEKAEVSPPAEEPIAPSPRQNTPQTKRYQVRISIDPSDAVIEVDGKRYTGSYSATVEEGDVLRYSVSARGFQSRTEQVTVDSDIEETWVLDPHPIENERTVSDTSIVRSIASGARMFAASDRMGSIAVYSENGERLWSRQTGNTATENSSPIIYGSRLLYSGDKEFLLLDALTGDDYLRISLNSEDTHLFGKQVVPMDSGFLLPGARQVTQYSYDGDALQTIIVPREFRMTPGVWNNTFFYIDMSGRFYRYDLNTTEQLCELTTNLQDPVALSPALYEDRAYIAGRKGNIACIDLPSNMIIWETTVPGGKPVFTDMEVGESGLFAYMGEKIIALDIHTGDILYTLSGASSPPLLQNNRLYYGTTNSRLRVADALTGEILKELETDRIITARPALQWGVLVAGTEQGSLLFIIPEAIR